MNKVISITLIGTMISFLLFFCTPISGETSELLGGKTGDTARKGEALVGEKVSIAPEVAKIFNEDVQTGRIRNDIPLKFIRTIFLPGQNSNFYAVSLFQIKNADLGFSSLSEESSVLRTRMNFFIRIYTLENGKAKDISSELYISYRTRESKYEYDPEEENIYSFGYLLPPGNFRMALAATSVDLTKIGTVYSDFSLPDTASIKGKLETTPLFSVKSLSQLPAPEMQLTLHKNSFVYGRLNIEPKIGNVFSQGENLDLFYSVLGAGAHPKTKKPDLEIRYGIRKGDEFVSVFPPQKTESLIVSQPIPLISRGKNLEDGNYTLVIEIEDNVLNIRGKKEFPFEIK